MDAITSEIRNKIKSAVKAKLQEIGAYVDEELPDYIMVMIANRRSKVQMTSELSLFLGNHTDKFTDWLHVVLEKLESFAISNNTSDTLKAAVSSIPKTTVTPAPLAKIVEPVTPTALPSKSLSATDSETLLETVKVPSPNQQEVPYKEQHISLPPKEIQYVPMPISQLPRQNVHHSPLEDLDDDCLNIREEDTKDADQEYHPEDKPARKESSVSHSTSKSNRNNKRRHVSSQEERDVKRLARDGRSRYSRNERRLPSQVASVLPRPTLLSQVVVKHTERRRKEPIKKYEEDEDVNQKNGVNSIVQVTARRKLPARMQATKSLILKAVADAQKSVTARPPKAVHLETQPSPVLPALFTRKYREKKQTTEITTVTITNPNANAADILQSIKLENEDTVAETEAMEITLENQGIVAEPMESPVQSPASSPISSPKKMETRFIVTLDGAHSIMSQRFEDALNEDDIEMTEPIVSAERKPVKSRLYRRRSTGSEADVQQPLERCKFWPNCRQGERCSFHHPKTPCKTFPNCLFGENCLFIHPHCKFDGSCNRRSCPYIHTMRAKPVVSVAPVVAIPVKQPPPVVHGKTVCKFFPSCNNVSCIYFHPPACKYGTNCTRIGCTFHHPSSVPASKLKWSSIK